MTDQSTWYINPVYRSVFTIISSYHDSKDLCPTGGFHCVKYEQSSTSSYPKYNTVCVKCGLTLEVDKPWK